MHLIVLAINVKLKEKDKRLPKSVKDLVKEFSCDIENVECMKSKCGNCLTWEADESYFQEGNEPSLNSTSDDSDDGSKDLNDCLKYYQWALVDKKANKVQVSLSFDQIEPTLNEKIKELKLHIYVRNEQYKIYNNLKAEMGENSILLHVDYAENYENKQQGECQSAYFGHTSFSIFTGAAYVHSNDKLEKMCLVIVSEAKDHSRIAAHSCIVKSIEAMIDKYTHLKALNNLNIRLWSDGCSAQFRFRYVFHLTTLFPSVITLYAITMNATTARSQCTASGGVSRTQFIELLCPRKL